MRRVTTLLAVLLAVAVGLLGCSSGSSSQTPEQRLAAAKHRFDQAQYIGFDLRAQRLPSGFDGLQSATGTGTHAPAFTGKVQVRAGLTFTAPVVAIGGKVWAKLPFVGWNIIDPAKYGAPDPSTLMSKAGGLSSLFTATRDPKTGSSQRHGRTVLTTITGTVPGRAMQRIFPSAGNGSFQASYALTDSDVPEVATFTGPFYRGHPDVTYVTSLNLNAAPVSIKVPR
ncbi:MAG TPA: LppX_LprAFG lipoprotein [Nocardioidaceae bacterium]|nr:LppX_LprAFG lipoprotein [Nocardioidaceae bacterium]